MERVEEVEWAIMYHVYILRNTDNKLYIGQTNNLERRLSDHRHNEIKFTREHRDFKLVYSEIYSTQLEAMQREKQLKKWTRAKKEALIQGDFDKLKDLSTTRKHTME